MYMVPDISAPAASKHIKSFALMETAYNKHTTMRNTADISPSLMKIVHV